MKKRSTLVHGKELNRLLFEYVYKCDRKNLKERKLVFEEINKDWVEYCYKNRKHKIQPPSPDAFKLSLKDNEVIKKIQNHLGLNPWKTTFIEKLLSIFWH